MKMRMTDVITMKPPTIFIYLFLFTLRERGREGKERERNSDV